MAATNSMQAQCGAKKRQGGAPCTQPAGWGTSHQGVGACKYHGGSSPNGELAGAKALATRYAAERFGLSNLQPPDAMLMCVRDAAGFVSYCKSQVAAIDADESLLTGGELNTWARLQMEGTERLARFADMAMRAGVAERQVRVAEAMGAVIAQAFERAIGVLELDAPLRAKAVRAYASAIAELEQETIEGTAA